MHERHKSFSRGGHCAAILGKGPFAIGADFQPPTPAGQIVRRVELDQDVLDRLEACVRRGSGARKREFSVDMDVDQQLFDDAADHLSLCNGVSDALTWYLSNWQFQANEKDIRDQLKGLERLIEQFSNALPDEFSPLGNFIHGTYTGEVFLKDGLKPDEDALIALQNAWRDQFGFVAIRDHLDVVRRYVLAARECLGGRRPLEHRKAALVRALARTW